MAYRDLTKEFENIRTRYVSKSSAPISGYHSEEDDEYGLRYTSGTSASTKGKKPLISPNQQREDVELGDVNNNNNHNHNQQQQQHQTPQWLFILKNVQDSIQEINVGLDVLRELHQQHCTFQLKKNFEEEERKVHIKTDEIKNLFLASKKLIELMKVSEKPKSEEELMKKNLKMSLITELNTLSIKFRDEQTEYFKSMERLKAKKRDNKVNYDDYDANGGSYADLSEEERSKLIDMEQQLQSDPGFTDEQIRQMLNNQQDIFRRDKELREILTSIVELNELFKEFSTLVVEQGTLLDRIDYNIESTYESMRSANENLVTAEKYQKMGGMSLCILLLIVMVVAFGLFFALKLVLKFSLGGGVIAFL